MALTRRNARRAGADSDTKPEVGGRVCLNRKHCQVTKKIKPKSGQRPKVAKIKMLGLCINELEPNKRLLMRDWLTREVELGEVKGLRWLDPEKTLLEIPWLHGSRHGWQHQDCELFKRWAEHTGKYSENEKDSKRWKANFRCAINSLPDVKEQTDLTQKKGANAFRVYKFLTAKPKRSQCKRISRRTRPYNRDFEKENKLMPAIKIEPFTEYSKNAQYDTPQILSHPNQIPCSPSPPLSITSLDGEASYPIRRSPTAERVLDIFDPDHSYAANTSSTMSGVVIPKVVEALNDSGKSLHQTGGLMYDNNPSPESQTCSSPDTRSGDDNSEELVMSTTMWFQGSSPRTDLDETDHQVTDMVTAWEMETEPQSTMFNCGAITFPNNYSAFGYKDVLSPTLNVLHPHGTEKEGIHLMQLT